VADLIAMRWANCRPESVPCQACAPRSHLRCFGSWRPARRANSGRPLPRAPRSPFTLCRGYAALRALGLQTNQPFALSGPQGHGQHHHQSKPHPKAHLLRPTYEMPLKPKAHIQLTVPPLHRSATPIQPLPQGPLQTTLGRISQKPTPPKRVGSTPEACGGPWQAGEMAFGPTTGWRIMGFFERVDDPLMISMAWCGLSRWLRWVTNIHRIGAGRRG
jgi:hypothetical protein